MPQANKLKGNEDGLSSMVSQMKDTLYLGNYTWLETRREWKWLVAVFPLEYSLLVSNHVQFPNVSFNLPVRYMPIAHYICM